MALGPDDFNVTVSLDSIFCFQGDDADDLFDEESEPYLWVFMIKIDGEGLLQQGNSLVGIPGTFFSPGDHGNIGGSIVRGTRRIPAEVGRWETSLKPIPISVAGQQLTTIPGTIIVAAVLMEENLTPNSAVAAAHASLKTLITNTVNSTIASLGLAGLAADAVAEVAIDAGNGVTTSLATAAQRVLQRRLKPIQDLFTVAASDDVVVTILRKLNIGGFIGTAIDADKPMGVFARVLSQAELSTTVESSPGLPHGQRIELGARMANLPDWAYNLHGETYAHHKFARTALPAAGRLQVTCSSKRGLGGSRRITGVGGLDNGAFWALGRGEAADAIRAGQHSFFVAGAGGHEVPVTAVQGGFFNGRPWFFLQTVADGDHADNLLNLPDCPPGAGTVEIWF